MVCSFRSISLAATYIFSISILTIATITHASVPITLVKDINPASGHAKPFYVKNVNGTILFSAAYDDGDRRLWKTDGTPEGTVLVKNITPIVNSSSTSYYSTSFTEINGTIYFAAKDDAHGIELWKSDGTTEGTVIVKDISPGITDSSPSDLFNANGTLYFSAKDSVNGRELWKSDGTDNGTVLVKNINYSSSDSNPSYMTYLNGTLYFSVNNNTLWRSDGTSSGTVQIKRQTINQSPSRYISNLINIDGTLFFTGDFGSKGRELWKSDGSDSGTTLVKDINPDWKNSNPTHLTNVNGTLYFIAEDSSNGSELWKSDGSEQGTVLVKDIAPGIQGSLSRDLLEVNGDLYLKSNDGTHGYELWKSDGTEIGTVMVKDIYPGGHSSAEADAMVNIDGTLYFNAKKSLYGRDIWKTDGTTEGTINLTNFDESYGSTTIHAHITRLDRFILFSASYAGHGIELWKLPTNQIPTISGKVLYMYEDTTLPFSLDRGADPDGNEVTYTITKQPVYGELIGTIPNLTYIPAPNFSGRDSLSFVANDGIYDSLTANIHYRVLNINDSPTGNITILGDAIDDQQLTANNTISDLDGLGVINYQWLRNGNSIANATNFTYTLSDEDVGTQISVVASYEDGHGTNESIISSSTSLVTNVNDAPTGTVTITGNIIEDEQLTVTNSLSDQDGLGDISYQWQRDGEFINGANTFNYTLSDNDVGAIISVTASFTDGYGTSESITSNSTPPVTNINDTPTGSVTISGDAIEDQQLTASNSLSDQDGLGEIRYQWKHDGNPINGATTPIYTLGDDDVSKKISVVASYVDGHGENESATSSPTTAVANLNDTPTGTVTFSGDAIEDQQLSVSNTLVDPDGLGEVSYQWLRNNLLITGATSSTYTLSDDDVGAAISVIASYTDTHGTNESITSHSTSTIANINDTPTGSVTISGGAIENQQLTISNSLADQDGLGDISYQWQRDGNAINGATASTYTLSDDDVGTQINVIASYVDGHGENESVTSSPTTAVANLNDAPTGTVTLAGETIEDQQLSASNTLVDLDGLGEVSYQWLRNEISITGATTSTYTLSDDDVGAIISVIASYTDTHGTNESITSYSTPIIANINDTPTGSVTISGDVIEDQQLTVSNSLADQDGLGDISYQWQRDGNAINRATTSTYTLSDNDVGTPISVVASYVDGHGENESVTSSPTNAVANLNDAPGGFVTISGTATENELLTVITTIFDADGLGDLNYQWLRNGFNIPGATTPSYTLSEDDVGAFLNVVVTYTDGHGTNETVTSDSTPFIAQLDSDSDGVVNSLDAFPNNSAASIDDDYDGFPDYWNNSCDTACQELSGLTLDAFLADTDNDGIENQQEQIDGTNINHPDSDGDGISDGLEKTYGTNPLASDSDNDGMTDGEEHALGSDPLNADSDDDKLSDGVELSAGTNPNDADTDGDDISDLIEGAGFNPPLDTDGDNTINALDLDSDNDGIQDNLEGANESPIRDSDGDTIPDVVDALTGSGNPLDVDGDGIGDTVECGSFPNCSDSDNDGQPDYTEADADDDGIPDAIESGPYVYVLLDTDGDSTPNFQDKDSDNDNIADVLEALITDINDSGIPNYADSDNDKIPDYLDKSDTHQYAYDSDGDGIRDDIECPLYPVCTDSNGNGQPDYTEMDSDSDGITDSIEVGPTPENPIDTDGDGLPNYQDKDSDNDGIEDIIELGINPLSPQDSDYDGIPDYVDAMRVDINDSDDDGIEDTIECQAYPDCITEDADGDGQPNYADSQDDDGPMGDRDGDGIQNSLDLDADNDGIENDFEGDSDLDGDGYPNYLDTDSDGDAISDLDECPNYPECKDIDGNGILDYLDSNITSGQETPPIDTPNSTGNETDQNQGEPVDAVEGPDANIEDIKEGLGSVNPIMTLVLLLLFVSRLRRVLPKSAHK